MKAITYTKYGPPDVLRLSEVQTPAPADDEVLVRIQAVSANPLDWHNMRGAPFLVRLQSGYRQPKDPRLGSDIAGRVEAVGKNVTQFRPGDEVFGAIGRGGFAEYAPVRETRLALKPANLTFEEAAAVPVAAVTALQALRDKGQIRCGQKVLINGASGGVGTFAVQIAKAYGAEVTGVCSTPNVAMVRGIGADYTIDYTKEDFAGSGKRYDLIVDVAGNRSVSDYKRALVPDGTCVVVGFSGMFHLFLLITRGAWASRTGSNRIGMLSAALNHDDLTTVKNLLECGKVKPVIDRRYGLDETPQAIRYLEQGHARGKVIVTVGCDSR